MSGEDTNAPGIVYLVGAGPGDPGLLTLKGAECIGRGHVVVYDYLANPALLIHAAASAKLVPLGPRGSARFMAPEDITALLVAEAGAGKTVVRLKGGDPSIFGRLWDETGVLRAAGIRYEIVPGITAGLAAAAYCEIPLTHQDDASAVALVTGRERTAKESSLLDYDGLAAFPGTLVLYMGVGRSGEWSRALVERGKSPDTPVAIVRRCSRFDQEVHRCSLGTVADAVAAQGLTAPAVFVVGEAAGRAPEVSWFSARPAFGMRVLVPGSPATSRKLSRSLAELGAEVMVEPAIRITDPPDWQAVDRALDGLHGYDWVVFSSANGVDALLGRLLDRGGDLRSLAGVRLAAMGSETAQRLEAYHLRADLVPEEFVAESMAQALVDRGPGGRILLVRPNRGRRVLGPAITQAGGSVDEVEAYHSVDVAEPSPEVAAALAQGEIDWIAVTSGSVIRSLVHLYGPALQTARFASIGPTATATLRGLGLEPAVEASPHTTAALVDAIVFKA